MKHPGNARDSHLPQSDGARHWRGCMWRGASVAAALRSWRRGAAPSSTAAAPGFATPGAAAVPGFAAPDAEAPQRGNGSSSELYADYAYNSKSAQYLYLLKSILLKIYIK